MSDTPQSPPSLEAITNLCKRRGFVFPSGELYGGVGAVYDLGPLGAALKQNIRRLWWERFVQGRDDVVGLESAVLTKREVLQASGHEQSFSDPLVECSVCHERFRADEEIPKGKDHEHKLNAPKEFNLMFSTHLGPIKETGSQVYLRPETAQGMFTNYLNILDTMRVKVPFGIAQVGKSFRNEITTGEFLYRVREFEIAEVEYFVKPGTDEEWFENWLTQWERFFWDLGIKKEHLKQHEHPKETLAHYSKRTVDLLYHFPMGWKELAGVANRGDFDLATHQKHSGKDLSYFDEAGGKKYLPYVIEPTLGLERALFAVLVDAYKEYKGGRGEGEGGEGVETVLHLDPRLAPFTAAVLPLVKKEKLPEIGHDLAKELKQQFNVFYDASGSIGRRYRRQDEIGTPWCITVDFDTQKDQTVTLRDRDTMKQERVKLDKVMDWIQKALKK